MINLKKISILAFSLFISQQVCAAVSSEGIVNGANGRFADLSKNFFSTKGYPDTLHLLNGTEGQDPRHGGDYQNHPAGPLAGGDPSNGGPITVIEVGKDGKTLTIAAHPDPSQRKDVSDDKEVQDIYKALKASPDGKVVVRYVNADGHKMIAVAWDKRALMGKRVDTVQHLEFFVYVTFPDPGF
jgi:hypothetical protein